jgi:hypothetical protein
VAAALDFIHRQGFVHRDVKPDNILFDAEGNAYVSDFGIAKVLAAGGPGSQSLLTGTGQILGTPQYMAPEQMLGQGYDGRVDQYALAASVYEVLSGQTPFDGATLLASYEQKKQPPPRLDQRARHIPGKTALAVQQALHREPDQRFKSCTEFADAVLSDAGSAARSGSGAQPAAPPKDDATVVERAVVFCPKCRQRVGVRAKLQGKRARCLNCQTAFVVPVLAQVAPTQRLLLPGTERSRPSAWWRLLGCAVVLLALAAVLVAGAYVYFEGWPAW